MLKKILSVARKDILVYFSDRRAMMMSLLVPIAIASFFAMIFGTGTSNGPTKIKTLIVNEDSDPLTAELIAKIGKAGAVEAVSATRAEAMAKVQKGDASVAVIFPKGFASNAKVAVFSGTPTDLDVFYDPSKGMDKAVVQGTLTQVIMENVTRAATSGPDAKAGLQLAIATTSDPKRRSALEDFSKSYQELQDTGSSLGSGQMNQPFQIKESAITAATGPDADAAASRAHIFGGMAMQGILFFAIEAAMSIQRDKQSGIWARMKAAPISSAGILLGRGLGSTVIAFFVLAAVFAFGIGVMGMRVHGSPLGMLCVMLASAAMTACFGLFVASLGKTEAQSRGMSVLAVLMMTMLGGAWFPIWMMPKAVQTVSLFVPVRYGVDGFDGALWRGATFAEILSPVAGLLAFAVLFAGIAIVRFRRTA